MKSSSAQHQWLQTRKRLLSQIKAQVGLRLGAGALSIPGYTTYYGREFKRPWKKSSHQELLKDVLHSQIVLGADFHAFSQSQRVHLRILREIPDNVKVVLALECFESRFQKYLQQWSTKKINNDQLLESVHWKKTWGFPFHHYLPLLELARDRGWKILGLNQNIQKRDTAALKKRDQHAADLIVNTWEADHPDLIYAIIGDLHLASPHLPKSIKKIPVGKNLKVTIVFQNAEELYFSAAKKGLDVDVLKLMAGKYCVLGSPPWVKWQSYLMYLEEAYDQEIEGLDIQDQFHSWLQFFIRDLNLSISVPEVSVHSGQDSTFGKNLKKILRGNNLKLAEKLIDADRSFFIPEPPLAYLSRYSLNHASTLAGFALHAYLSQRKRVAWNFPEDLRKNIWLECVGFFFSKLMNHKRKPENLFDMNVQLLGPSKRTPLFKQALQLAIQERIKQLGELSGRAIKTKAPKVSAFGCLEAARILGTHLGDELFQSFRSGQVSVELLNQWLRFDIDAKDFNEFFLSALERFSSSRLK